MDLHFKPSPLLQALAPIQQSQRVTEDKYINIKEQYLLEKYLLQQQIDKENEK